MITGMTTTTIGFQGVPGAYSELASRLYFGKRAQTKPFGDFSAVFQAVAKRKVNYGVVPIENSLAGSIHQNYDLLLSTAVTIVGEVVLPIQHCLVAPPKFTLSQLKRVLSHPQALAQCADYLEKRKLQPTAFFDTAGAAAHVSATQNVAEAAIASAEAATHYGLKILARNIANKAENFTRFLVIQAKKTNKAPSASRRTTGPQKTSVAFALKSIPGALYKALSVFAIREIDLLKIESRPLPDRPWQYLFYLDFAGSIHDAAVPRTLEHLEEITEFVHCFGSYARTPTQ
jgi:prephenate dehydratase